MGFTSVNIAGFPFSSFFPKGLQTSIDCIAKAVPLHGPFDGFIGFSQGAAIAALICLQCAIRRCNQNNIDAVNKYQAIENKQGPNFPSALDCFKFAILFAGFRSQSSCHAHIYEVTIQY